MGAIASKGAAAARGGLRARFSRFIVHPAFLRILGLAVGLIVLGAAGHYLGTPAHANMSGGDMLITNSVTRIAADSPLSVDASVPGASQPLSGSAAPDPLDGGPFERTAMASGAPAVVGDGGDALIDLNRANADELRRLPGIGAKRATAILALRQKLGRFQRIEDLMRIRGFGRAAMKRLRPLVTFGPPLPTS